jgi:hypothetical protein
MMQRVQSNMEIGADLAGFGYFPPLAVHLFVRNMIYRIA